MLLGVVRERDAERGRVARLLHDEIGQVLSAVGLHLDVLRLDLQDRAPEIVARTTEIQRLLENAVQHVRRLSYELCPEPVERTGLGVALQHLVARTEPSCPGRLQADCPNALDLPPAAAVALFRIAAQAIDNALRHSGAARIRAVVRRHRRGVTLQVRDNGRGFDPARARRRPAGLGLLLMEAFARNAGLKFSVASAPGRGTIVRAEYQPAEG
jgi:two-component system NarL family sensor kinase